MSIPKLYTVLPKKENGTTPNIELLTDLSSGVIEGSDGEKYAVLSYFPEKLKLSRLNNFVINKYVLFVLDEDESQNYTVEWEFDVTDAEGSVIDRFVRDELMGSDLNFEFCLGLKDLGVPDTQDWELTLKVSCFIFKNAELDIVIDLEHTLVPIEADLLSTNGASFEDESGEDKTSVYLGNEATTHFMRGHLSEYLVAKKESASKIGVAPNTVDVFVNETAAIAYLKVMRGLDSLISYSTTPDLYLNLSSSFDWIFTDRNTEDTIIFQQEFEDDRSYKNIGICDLNLHHVLSFLLETENDRVSNEGEIIVKLKNFYDFFPDDFITSYHRCVFPKSAIDLSVEILDRLFTTFKAEAHDSNHIYETFETVTAEKNAKIEAWTNLKHSELREKSNDRFMKNLISEYYQGYFGTVTPTLISASQPQQILKIDWSQFIQKILNPTTITVPFTLIKIQVNDLRSGKPIKNALVSQIEFHSFEDEPDYALDARFRYVISKPHDSTLIIASTDSKNKRVQKICKLMGYYTGDIDDGYGGGMRTAMHAYLTSADRLLPIPIDAPESASEAHLAVKKDAWIDYIIEDFESNCITDGDGILNCRVPDQLLDGKKLNINVGFAQFAVVREIFGREDRTIMSNKPIRRPVSFDGSLATEFMAHWVGDPGEIPMVNPNEQNLDWEQNLSSGKNFGWKITEYTGMNPNDTISPTNQLRIAIPFNVKKSKTEDYNKYKIKFSEYSSLGFTIDDYDHFSTFYLENGIHFVLFGMQWCQPLMDGLKEGENDNQRTIVDHALITRKDRFGQWVKNNQMHIVSKHYGGNDDVRANEPKSHGQYYGFYDKNPVNHQYRKNSRPAPWTHDSTDLFTTSSGNTPVFSMVFGKFRNYNSGSYGLASVFIWFYYEGVAKKLLYAHLDSREALHNSLVLPGQKIGISGRNGTSFSTNEPAHLHLQILNLHTDAANNATSIEPRILIEEKDPDNAVCLPSNKLPIMLPCNCHYGSEARRTEVGGCKGGDSTVAPTCWALKKFSDYDYKSSRALGGNDNYHEFPEKLINTSDHDKYFFACSYISKKPMTTLSSALVDTGNEVNIRVLNSSDFSNNGALLIDDEVITYTSNNRTTNTFGGCTRGAKSTVKGNHLIAAGIHYLNFENYYIQAHLKYIYVNRGKPGIPNFTIDIGSIDNTFTNTLKNVTINLIENDVISVLNSESGFSEIEKGGVKGWVEDRLIDDNGGTKSINHDLATVLNNKVTSNSLLGMYEFLRMEGKINYVDYASNFDSTVNLVKSLRNYI